jgi:cysteine desulfurase family protein (TIGR01976 family)
MTTMPLDVAAVRKSFPALAQGVAHFDGPVAPRPPSRSPAPSADTLCAGIANQGSVTAAERRATAVVDGARQAVAELLGSDPRGVVFGRSMTQLTYDVSRAMAKQWGPGDEVVVTRLDHDANVRPWVQAAEAAGATLRWAEFDRDTGELPLSAVTDRLSPRTRLVAFTAASNLLGTRPDVAAITEAVHTVGALAYADGVHLTPHAGVDVRQMGADFFACSPYKFFGPHLGILVADPALLESVHPDKLLPSSNDVPDRFELGTLPYELLAGVTATVDFLADLAPGGRWAANPAASRHGGSREHEDRLFRPSTYDGLRLVGRHRAQGDGTAAHPHRLVLAKRPRASEVYEHLATRASTAPAGSFYAIESLPLAGSRRRGACARVSAPYTDRRADIERLAQAALRSCAHDRAVLVTGASRGIGRAIAVALRGAG